MPSRACASRPPCQPALNPPQGPLPGGVAARHAPWPPRPRLAFTFRTDRVTWKDDEPLVTSCTAAVQVWCIWDWMRTSARSSSSHEKWPQALPAIQEHAFSGVAPDLVIALGTAGLPGDDNANGCVTIGSRVYVHDAFDTGRGTLPRRARRAEEALHGPLLALDTLPLKGVERRKRRVYRADDRLSGSFFQHLPVAARQTAKARFLAPPVDPTLPLRILSGRGYASIGTLNVTNYDDYVWADAATERRFETEIRQREIGSAETTHGLIRLTWERTPFLFVSGLTDRLPHFNAQVTPRVYAQNFAAAHNAGVALAHLLAELPGMHLAGKLFPYSPP